MAIVSVWRVIHLIMLALFVVGCTRQNPSHSDTQQVSTDVVRITFAGFAEGEQRYTSLIAEFNQQHANIEVQFVPVSSATYQQGDFSSYLDELVTKGDTFIVNRMQLDGNAIRFLDLSPLMNGDEQFAADDFWPGALEGCATADNSFGLPINLGFSMIFYDKNAFVDADIDPPSLDWTWDDFLATAQPLTQQEAGETGRFGFANTQNSGLLFYPLLAADDLANGSPDVVQFESILNEYIALHEAGVMPVPDASRPAWQQRDQMEDLVLQGKVAMWTDWQGFLNGRQFSLGELADVQMVPFPAIGDNTKTTPVSILLCGAVSAGTAYPQAAWEWLQFLSMNLNDDVYGRIPARRSLTEGNPVWQSQIEPDMPLGYALRHAYYPPIWFDKTAVDTLITQTIAGELAVADVLTELEIASPVIAPLLQATPLPVATAAPPLAQETAVIRYFVDFRTHGDIVRVQNLADQFNASQDGVQVSISSNVQAAVSFSLGTVASQYDCFSWGPLSSGNTAHLYALTPLLATESIPIDAFDEHLRSQFVQNGIQFGIPANSIPTIITLNKDYWEAIGADLPAADWTVADLMAYAGAVAGEQDGRPVYGFTTLQGEEGSVGLLLADNVKPYSVSDNTVSLFFDSPETITAVTQLVDLANNQTIFPAFDLGSHSLNLDNWERRRQLIITGQVAMWTTIAGLEEEVSFERMLMPLPQDIIDFAPPISTGYYISKRLDNPTACWAWLSFLSAQETAVIGVPARASIAESSAWQNSVGRREAAIYTTSLARQLNSPLTLDTLLLTTPLQSWWNDVLAEAFAGGDVVGLLQEAQRKGTVYAVCVNNAVLLDREMMTACAWEADPEYKTFEELAQELGG
ncbi:hypothetical protein MNBD_CHLOROFLEXI01-1284 [hydrothermal vent metagenome]|uniref:Extracellular solute-binding protein n=1 Tax=hydrothermal vent metagenome TaxID=652676 RepID=A0A3B0VV18_9ZZZZ